MDFCEEDIRDAFSVFKDRFIVRKVVRESKHPVPQSAPYPQTNLPSTSSYSMQNARNPQMISRTLPQQNIPRHSVSETMRQQPLAYPSTSTVQSAPSRPGPYPVTLTRADTSSSLFHAIQLKTEPRVRSPTVSSTMDDQQRRSTDSRTQPTVESPTVGNVHVIDFTQPIKKEVISPTAQTSGVNIKTENNASAASTPTKSPQSAPQVLPYQLLHGAMELVTMDERNRLKKYTAEELLGKKSLRGRPNEAQHLGSLAIRNAAQAAKIWDTAPLLRDISSGSKETFVKYIQSFAPQMASKMDLVFIRLREALQNRRKYLSDRDSGKRAAVKPQPNTPSKTNIVPDQLSPIKIEDAGSLIDLTD